MAAQNLFYSVVTDAVKSALQQYGVEVPKRRMTYAELASWIQGRVKGKDRELVALLRNHQAMNRIENVLKKASMGTQFQNLLGRHEKTARMLNRARWTKSMEGAGRTGLSSRGVSPSTGREKGGVYQQVYAGILRRSKGAIEMISTPRGKKAVHDAILKETGSYNKALEGVRFLEKEAERMVAMGSFTGGAKGGDDIEGGYVQQGTYKPRAQAPWYKKLEAQIIKKVRSGDELWMLRGMNLDSLETPSRKGQVGRGLRRKMQREGKLDEYLKMQARVMRAVDSVIAHGGPLTTRKEKTPLLQSEGRKKMMLEYTRKGRAGLSQLGISMGGERFKPGKFMEEWKRRYGKRDVGKTVLTFGKYKGKSLDWVYQHKAYYLSFLDNYVSGSRAKGMENKVDLAINTFLQTANVSKFLDDYLEEAGGSSPRDTQPYWDRRTGKGAKTKGGGRYKENWEGAQLSWRDPGVWRKGGFAVSDNTKHENVLFLGRGRVTQAGWDPEIGKWVPGLGGYVYQEGGNNLEMRWEQNWKYRKKEFRWDDPSRYAWDAGEYQKSLARKEMMDVVGRHYSTYGGKGDALERFKRAAELSPYMATGFSERLESFLPVANKFFGLKTKEEIQHDILKQIPRGYAGLSTKNSYMSPRMTSVEMEVAKRLGEKLSVADIGQHGTRFSARKGAYDPNAAGAMENLNVDFLSLKAANKLKTRWEFSQWYDEVGHTIGWDVVNFYAKQFDFDVNDFVMSRWNKLKGKPL